jgi:hypothetical protein
MKKHMQDLMRLMFGLWDFEKVKPNDPQKINARVSALGMVIILNLN